MNPLEETGKGKAASAIVEDLLRVLRAKFYTERDEKRWHWERSLLVKAITTPAWVLSRRGAELPAERYQAILLGIIETIEGHGSPETARNFGRYFLASVQSHMRIHGAAYYVEAKSFRRHVQAQVGALSATSSSPVAALAEAHKALLAPVKGGRRKASAATQAELF